MKAKKKPLEEKEPADSASSRPRLKFLATEEPPARKAGVKVGSVEELVDSSTTKPTSSKPDRRTVTWPSFSSPSTSRRPSPTRPLGAERGGADRRRCRRADRRQGRGRRRRGGRAARRRAQGPPRRATRSLERLAEPTAALSSGPRTATTRRRAGDRDRQGRHAARRRAARCRQVARHRRGRRRPTSSSARCTPATRSPTV